MNYSNVLGALSGFFFLGVIILVGYLAVRFKVVSARSETVLNRFTFSIATPALLFLVTFSAKTDEAFSVQFAALTVGIFVCLAITMAVLWVAGTRKASHISLLAVSGVWVNSNIVGLPLAIFVFGDASAIAPMLLFQMVILSPVMMLILDLSSPSVSFREAGVLKSILRPARNPLTLATITGFLLGMSNIQPPRVFLAPVEILANAAIPLMLLAFGISLFTGPPLSGGTGSTRETWIVSAFKLLIFPVITLLIAYFIFGLRDEGLAAIALMAALPTAQNIYMLASRYDILPRTARDIVLVTTVGSIPVLLVVVAVF
jgi:malonate transporter